MSTGIMVPHWETDCSVPNKDTPCSTPPPQPPGPEGSRKTGHGQAARLYSRYLAGWSSPKNGRLP